MPLKLTYFFVRGRGECIRYVLHQAGVEFEDCRITMEDWPALKPKTPFGSLPMLENDEGLQLAQTITIARAVARRHNLVGKDDIEAAKCDMLVDGANDMYTGLAPVNKAIMFEKDEEKAKNEFANFKEKTLIPFMDRYEKFLEKNGTGYFVGDQLTWADLIIAEWLDRCKCCYDPTCLDNHPKLKEHCDRIHNLPNIKNYVESRPKTPL